MDGEHGDPPGGSGWGRRAEWHSLSVYPAGLHPTAGVASALDTSGGCRRVPADSSHADALPPTLVCVPRASRPTDCEAVAHSPRSARPCTGSVRCRRKTSSRPSGSSERVWPARSRPTSTRPSPRARSCAAGRCAAPCISCRRHLASADPRDHRAPRTGSRRETASRPRDRRRGVSTGARHRRTRAQPRSIVVARRALRGLAAGGHRHCGAARLSPHLAARPRGRRLRRPGRGPRTAIRAARRVDPRGGGEPGGPTRRWPRS